MSAKDTLILSGTASFYKTHSDLFELCRHIQPFRIFIQTDSAEKSETGADYVLENAQDFDIIPMRSGLQIKLIYNAVTTAAHIFKGKVYRNKMIDLRISNNKLYYRSIRIIQDITGASEEKAEEALLRTIYESDVISDRERNTPVSRHIIKATEREKIVPAALILASGNVTYAEALKKIQSEHIIRNIIKKL